MNATVSILLRLFLRRQLDNKLSMKNNFLRLLIKGCQPSPASDTTIDSFEARLIRDPLLPVVASSLPIDSFDDLLLDGVHTRGKCVAKAV